MTDRPIHPRRHLTWRAACLLPLVTLGLAQAQTTAPTSSSLNATSGYLSISSESVSRLSASGFGGGTIYYPRTAGQYGLIAISPGFTATQSSVAWIGEKLSSHGFVVIVINTNSTLDQPSSRARQLRAALSHVLTRASATVRGRIDPSRQAVAGHSMGGGGSLIAAEDDPTLKAAFPLTPWNTTSSFTQVRVPTMIFGADGDTVAAVTVHARPFYTSIPSTTSKAYAELQNATHFAPNVRNEAIGRYGVAWMKRFMDGDTRYSTFLCGAEHNSYNTALRFDRYQSNCPY
jgi:predicted dienelactone hydrolase